MLLTYFIHLSRPNDVLYFVFTHIYFRQYDDEDDEDELLEQQQQTQRNNYAMQPAATSSVVASDNDSSGTISGMLADFSRSIGKSERLIFISVILK